MVKVMELPDPPELSDSLSPEGAAAHWDLTVPLKVLYVYTCVLPLKVLYTHVCFL